LQPPFMVYIDTNSNSKHGKGYFENRRFQCVFKMCFSMIENGIGMKHFLVLLRHKRYNRN